MGKAGRQVRWIPSKGPHSMASFICRKHGSVPLGLGLLPVEGPGRFFLFFCFFWFFGLFVFPCLPPPALRRQLLSFRKGKRRRGETASLGRRESSLPPPPRTPLFRTPGERARPLEARAGWGVGVGVGVVRMGSGAREPGGPTRARSDGGGGEEPGGPGGGGRRGRSPPLHPGSRGPGNAALNRSPGFQVEVLSSVSRLPARSRW